MLIKKVNCTVKKEEKETFSNGQERWRALENCEGFIAQYGGWSHGNVATIIGFWKDEPSYARFMKNDHNAIYSQTQQQNQIESIDVQIDERVVSHIAQYAKNWLHEQQSEVNEKWTVTTESLEERR